MRGTPYGREELAAIDSPRTLRELVGDKAAEMVELYRDVRALDGNFPTFTVLGTAALDGFLEQIDDRFDGRDFPELPSALTVPEPVRAAMRPFHPVVAQVLSQRTEVKTVLRSSMCWPGRERPPGVDSTTVHDSTAPWMEPGFPACFYKAYTTMGLEIDDQNPRTSRRGGLIIMDLIARLTWQGTAYVRGDHLMVELARWGGGGVVQHFADARTPELAAGLGHRGAERLCRVLNELAAVSEQPHDSYVEFEFLIDRDDEVIVLQRRVLAGGAGIFHTVGEYDGQVHDLRRLDREDLSSLDKVLSDSDDRAVLAPLFDQHRLDAFALAWRIRATDAPHPSAVILAAGEGSRSGMPIHVPWLLRRVLPKALLVVADQGSLPDQVTAAALSSDGIEVSSQWTGTAEHK